MGRSECAGLKVIRNTLSPNRETEITILNRGPYGQIEDWDGSIIVEVTNKCWMSEEACLIVAEALANDEMQHSVYVSKWNVMRSGRIMELHPVKWEEVDIDSGLRIQ